MAFITSSWWDLTAQTDQSFTARLISVEDKRLATTNDFDSNGSLKEKNASNILLLDQGSAEKLTASLEGKKLTVKSIEDSPRTERPKPPFTTSTMQQDADLALGGERN
jgi:DNA topoisomerase-1